MSEQWWSKYFKYRKSLVFDNTNLDLTQSCIAYIFLPTTLIEQGKIREDLSDIRVVTRNEPYTSDSIRIWIEENSIVIQIRYYPLPMIMFSNDYVDDRFYVYYGDFASQSPDSFYEGATPNGEYDLPDDYSFGAFEIPEFSYVYNVDAIRNDLGLTRPGEHWQYVTSYISQVYLASAKEQEGAKLSYLFHGTSVGLYCNVGPIYGIIEVGVDGDYVEVDLYEEEEEPIALVFKAEALPDVRHNLTVVNTGRRNPAAGPANDYYSELELSTTPVELYEPVNVYAIGVAPYAIASVGEEEIADIFTWNSKLGGNI